MADKLVVELDREGVRSLLRSEEAMTLCKSLANGVVSRLGPGHEMTSMVGKNRVNAEVAAVSPEAIRKNLQSNTILKAMGG